MKKQRKQYNSTLSFIETVLLYDIKFKNIEHRGGKKASPSMPSPEKNPCLPLLQL